MVTGIITGTVIIVRTTGTAIIARTTGTVIMVNQRARSDAGSFLLENR